MAETNNTQIPDEQCNLTTTPTKSICETVDESSPTLILTNSGSKTTETEAAECDGEGNPPIAAIQNMVIEPVELPKRRNSPRRPELSAARLPHHILIQIFQYMSMKDLQSCMLTCHSWNNALSVEDSEVWQSLVLRNVPDAALTDPFLFSELGSSKKKLRAWSFAWNANDISRNNYIRTNGFTVHRQPVAQSTDGVRGKRGISHGVHAFDIVWEGPLGTVAVVGFATKHAALHCVGYIALLGSDEQSWGWNLVDNMLMHNSEQLGVYPKVNNPPKYEMGERIRLVIDCDKHVAYFERGAEFLGVAFSHLPPVRLYPAVCAVYGNTEVSMVYVGSPAMG